jgi:chromosome segregation ATPase
VQVEVEKIQEDLELERKSKLNLQKNSTLLEDEILKEKSTRSNLEKEFVDIRTRFEKLYQSKNNLENLHQQKVEEFRTKFKIVEGLADNQTDLGMQLKITQLDLFSTGCKLMKKEQEYQELQTLLENEKAALRLMISKYELDLQSKQNELTFAKDNINEHLLRITHLNNEIQRLNNDKNEMFDEYDRLKNEAEKELQKLRSKCESLKREKNLLIRGQKIGLISKGIK